MLQIINQNLKDWFLYLFTDNISLLLPDLLLPLICTKIGVLLTINRVVCVCVIMVSATTFVNNGCSFECLVLGFQNKAV